MTGLTPTLARHALVHTSPGINESVNTLALLPVLYVAPAIDLQQITSCHHRVT